MYLGRWDEFIFQAFQTAMLSTPREKNHEQRTTRTNQCLAGGSVLFPKSFLEAPWVEAESVREDIFRTNIHNTFAFRNCVSKSRSWECSRMETTVIRTRSGWNHCMLVTCGERHSWWVWNCACISIYCIYISMHIQILCVWLFFLFDSWITKPDAVWNSWRL